MTFFDTLIPSILITNDVIVYVGQFVLRGRCNLPGTESTSTDITTTHEMLELKGSNVFTSGDEKNNSMPFLEAKLARKEEYSVKIMSYMKKTHSNQ